MLDDVLAGESQWQRQISYQGYIALCAKRRLHDRMIGRDKSRGLATPWTFPYNSSTDVLGIGQNFGLGHFDQLFFRVGRFGKCVKY